jgi:glycosyltransferase involved in cell wall biosynthesis
VTHLDRSRFEPLVACPEPGPLPERLKEAGIPFVVHANTRLARESLHRFARDVFWYRRLIRRERIDLVHANVGGSRSSAAFAARLCGVPYLQHVRNSLKAEGLRHFGFRWAARVIVNSNDAGRMLYADERFRVKTRTIYNGVELARYQSREDRRHELPDGKRPVLGFVGQIVERKGIATILRAMPAILSRLPDAVLVIVGCAPPDSPDYYQECLQLVSRLGIGEHVTWTGYRRDVPEWMRTFDLFVFPTRAEPFGKVVIEAMAAECPVVASAVGGIPEIISRPELGTLIPPDDPESLAGSAIELLEDRARARAMGAAGAAHAWENFAVDAMAEKLQALYSEVISERRGRGLRIAGMVARR